MLQYTLRRIGYMLATLWVIVTLTFVLMHMIPGNPFALNENKRISPEVLNNLNHKYGLDKPLWEQYVIYMGKIAHGDLGNSMQFLNRDVNQMIAEGFPNSAKIGLIAFVYSVILGIGLGILAALNQGKFWDYGSIFIALLGISIPAYITGSLLQYLIGVKLKWLPVAGFDNWKFWIMPAFSLGLGSMAFLARLMRASTVETLGQDYIRTARAKGLSRFEVIWRHGIRNSLIPVVTILGPMFMNIITGAFFIEMVFAVPGLGKHFVTSVQNLDYTLIMGTTIFYGVLILLGLLFVDISYGLVDPRIRVAKGRS